MANNRISALRHEYGLNQKELGEKLGVGQTTVSAWEKGKNEPDNETLHKMAQLFRCSIDYLLGHANDERTRGLPQEERAKLTENDRAEKQLAKYERELYYQEGGLTPEEEEDLIESTARQEYETWLETHPDCYFETFKVNQLCERLNATQRKCLLTMASAYEEGIRADS